MSSLPSPPDNPLGASSGPNERGGCDFRKIEKSVKKKGFLIHAIAIFQLWRYVISICLF
jgi:hypothetical protein